MSRTLIAALLCACAAVTSPSCACAQLFDFELNPGGVAPVDNEFLINSYALADGGTVQFFFDVDFNSELGPGDLAPVFEWVGEDGTDGFANSTSNVNDDPAPGYEGQLGNFFLRQPLSGLDPPPFIIDFITPTAVTALSGQIWDIDGTPLATERWRVDVLNSLNAVIATQFSPLGDDDTLDAKPWTFSFAGLPEGADSIRIRFIGSKTEGVGLAFDNFRPLGVPEAGSAVLAAVGWLAGWGLRRRWGAGDWR